MCLLHVHLIYVCCNSLGRLFPDPFFGGWSFRLCAVISFALYPHALLHIACHPSRTPALDSCRCSTTQHRVFVSCSSLLMSWASRTDEMFGASQRLIPKACSIDAGSTSAYHVTALTRVKKNSAKFVHDDCLCVQPSSRMSSPIWFCKLLHESKWRCVQGSVSRSLPSLLEQTASLNSTHIQANLPWLQVKGMTRQLSTGTYWLWLRHVWALNSHCTLLLVRKHWARFSLSLHQKHIAHKAPVILDAY